MPLHTQTCCCCRRCCKCKLRWSEPSFKTHRGRHCSTGIPEEDSDVGGENQNLDNDSQSMVDSRKNINTGEICSPSSQLSSKKPVRARRRSPHLRYSDDSDGDDNEVNGHNPSITNIRSRDIHHIRGHRIKKRNDLVSVDEKSMREMLQLRVSSEMLKETSSWQRQERLQNRLERIGALITATMVYSDALDLALRAGNRVRRLLRVDTRSPRIKQSLSHKPGSPRHSREQEEMHEKITKSLLKIIDHKTESESESDGCHKKCSNVRKCQQKVYSSREIDAALELPQALVQVMSVHRSRRKDFLVASNRLETLLVDPRHLSLPQLRSLEQQYGDVAGGLCRSGELLEEHLPDALTRRISTLSSVIEGLRRELTEVSDEMKKMLIIFTDLCEG